MSIPRQANVSCPKCGKKFLTTTFESVNTDNSIDIVETIISGKRFDAPCPSCGFVAHLEYDMLYHDMKHGAMIWVVHNNSPEYAKKIAEIRSMKNVWLYKFTRIVADMNALREKVACLEAGRDDRIIELCKVFLTSQLMEQRPDFHFQNAFYTYSQGEEFVFFYDTSGNEVSCTLGNDVYELIEGVFNKSLNKMTTAPYQIIDAPWAVSFFDNADFVGVKNSASTDSKATCLPVGNSTTSPSKETTSLKFHKFIWYVWMPWSLLTAIYNAWEAITEWAGYLSSAPDFSQVAILVMGCLMEFAFVLAPLVIFIGFFRWKKYAWYILMLLSLSNVICSPFLVIFNWNSYDLATILGKCVGVGFDIIILLYYWKRRWLFNVGTQKGNKLNVAVTLGDHAIEEKYILPLAYCHKCGNKLVSGSRFCNKCGTRVPTPEGE